jgi:5-methylcytosine-specific restriction endonuclease McrA
MPIDKSAMDLITPIFDTTLNNNQTFMSSLNGIQLNSNEQKILSSGKQATKRCVSETKKKYVASRQNWCCGKCNKQLNAWFEVDHKLRLENGGGNDVGNLIALCRECHGEKTAMENL